MSSDQVRRALQRDLPELPHELVSHASPYLLVLAVAHCLDADDRLKRRQDARVYATEG